MWTLSVIFTSLIWSPCHRRWHSITVRSAVFHSLCSSVSFFVPSLFSFSFFCIFFFLWLFVQILSSRSVRSISGLYIYSFSYLFMHKILHSSYLLTTTAAAKMIILQFALFRRSAVQRYRSVWKEWAGNGDITSCANVILVLCTALSVWCLMLLVRRTRRTTWRV